MSCLFNSYDPYFKQPFGAVRAGQTVHLSLCIPEELGYVDPHLVIQKEGKNDVPVHYRMKFDGQTPKQNHFSVDVTLGDVGLYFYYFDLYTDFRRIVRGPDNCGVVSWQEGESWQLTVYEPSFQTPDSIKGRCSIRSSRTASARAWRTSLCPSRTGSIRPISTRSRSGSPTRSAAT